jgi:adenosine deaminase
VAIACFSSLGNKLFSSGAIDFVFALDYIGNSIIPGKVNPIPKVILHTHLEGSIPAQTLDLLRKRSKVDLSFDPFSKHIYESIQAHQWDTFRKIYFEICSCFNTEEDFHDGLFQYGEKLHGDGVIYAEVMFSPWKHLSRDIALDTMARGLLSAVEQLYIQYGITIKVICDFVRHKDERCHYMLDWMRELPMKHFVAMGISGGSTAVDRIHYRGYCEMAKENGFKISAHAGEIEGPASVMEILDYLYADRIGHGVRSIENEDLINRLAEQQIHFEICPTANKIIGLCRDNFDPIRAVISKGINFSINPDDELIFDTDIDREIDALVSDNVISKNCILELQRNALRNSFADAKVKRDIFYKYFVGN